MRVCRSPKNIVEFEQYYQLRWQVLREPWGQTRGSERDKLENNSIHRMIIDENGQALAVGRLDYTEQFAGQIRFVAVSPLAQGQGLGQEVMAALEQKAKHLGIKSLHLKARENAISFYQKIGYQLQEYSHILFDEVKHFCMQKALTPNSQHQLDETLALQKIWYDTIPLSKAMNVQISYFDGKSLMTHCALEFNKNIHDTMFAGSIYTLATLSGWGWIYLQLQQQGLTGTIVLAEANIEYFKPILVPGYAKLIDEDVTGDVNLLRKGKSTRISLVVNIYNGEVIAAKFAGSYAVLPVK
jgi:thioesterase domain-containing protein